MASFLDISLIGHFSDIFVLLFIFTITYAILLIKGPFGTNKGLNALIALSVSMMFIFSNDLIDIVKNTVPWFILMFIVLIMVLFVTQSIGSTLAPFFKNISTIILIIGILILFVQIGLKFGQDAGPFLGNANGTTTTIDPDNVIAGGDGDVASDSFSQNFGATIFHPKVLALILVMLVSLFAVLMIWYVN